MTGARSNFGRFFRSHARNHPSRYGGIVPEVTFEGATAVKGGALGTRQ